MSFLSRVVSASRLSTRLGSHHGVSRRHYSLRRLRQKNVANTIESDPTISTDSPELDNPASPHPSFIGHIDLNIQQDPPASTRGGKRKPLPWLRTLRPDSMADKNQELFCLKTQLHLNTPFGDRFTSFYLGVRRDQPPLPTDRPGVFYFHRNPSSSELSGEIRFRFCDSIRNFNHGEDYMVTPYQRYAIRLHQIARFPRYVSVRQMLIEDGFTTQDILNDLGRLPNGGENNWLYHINQPFTVNLRHPRLDCAFVTRQNLVVGHFEGLYKDFRPIFRRRFVAPYAGFIRACFEISTLPQHKKHGPTLVMRILELLSPIEPQIEYDQYIPLPEPGMLVSRNFKERGYEPWTYKLNGQAQGTPIIRFIQQTSPELLKDIDQ